jgi:hypothetical protein
MQNFNNYNNNYNPYGYYPYQQQTTQQLNLYAFVDGLEGAKAYQVKPNTMMLLMDSQKPICYKKQVNGYGQTVAFEIYDLVPHVEEQQANVEYITRNEFAKEIADLKALLNKGE